MSKKFLCSTALVPHRKFCYTGARIFLRVEGAESLHFPPGSKYEQDHDPAHGAGRLERRFQNPFRGHCYRTCHFSDHLSAVFCVGCFPRKKECRLVLLADGVIAGWTALRRVDPRWCYRGVAEVSIYVGEQFRGHGLGLSSTGRAVPSGRKGRLLDTCSPPCCRTTLPAAPCTQNAAFA